jgi:tetrahydrodipicolinate N-succinyltransferase
MPPSGQQTQPARPAVGGGGMATAALVLGILALITCWTVIGGVLLGLLAVIFGIIGLRRANRGLALGRGRAIAGIILGVLSIVVAGVLIAAGLSLLNSDEGKNLQSCLKDAGSNQSQVQQCQDEFRDKVNGS